MEFAEQIAIFIDQSVPTGDISDGVSDEYIRELIRDEYLRDSTVTIVLVGTETARRKHVDWEIYSSMYDGRVNKKYWGANRTHDSQPNRDTCHRRRIRNAKFQGYCRYGPRGGQDGWRSTPNEHSETDAGIGTAS